MTRHPNAGEDKRIALGLAFDFLAGDPSRSPVARVIGGVAAPVLLLAYAIRCFATGSAWLPGRFGGLDEKDAVAIGVASVAAALFLVAHCLVRKDGFAGWAKRPVELLGLGAFALSVGFVACRMIAAMMA